MFLLFLLSRFIPITLLSHPLIIGRTPCKLTYFFYKPGTVHFKYVQKTGWGFPQRVQTLEDVSCSPFQPANVHKQRGRNISRQAVLQRVRGDKRDFCFKPFSTFNSFFKFQIKFQMFYNIQRKMTKTRALQQYSSKTALIWPDGLFKKFILIVRFTCVIFTNKVTYEQTLEKIFNGPSRSDEVVTTVYYICA